MKALLISFLILMSCAARADNWPAWRGPTGMGLCAESNLPLKWDRETNVRWKTPLPEPSNSTPIVWEDQVIVNQTAGQRRLLIAFDRKTGAVRWESGIDYPQQEPTHKTNPYCSGSPVTDGEVIISSFASGGLYACDMKGNKLWHRDLGRQEHIWGNGASPVIWKDLCFLNFGPGERTFLIAVNRKTGKTEWKHDEPGGAHGKEKKWIGSWSTPILVDTGDRSELIMTWPNRVCAYDPASGKEIWTSGGLNPLVYTSPLFSDGVIVGLGGYSGQAVAVRAGGSGDVTESHRLWHHPKTKQRIGSAVIHGGHIYILNDPGIAECIELKTGKTVWQERLQGPGGRPKSWSSMVCSADGRLYVINQSGDCFVVKASPKFELLATNPLGELSNSSIAVSNGELFIRTHKHLWCIGK